MDALEAKKSMGLWEAYYAWRRGSSDGYGASRGEVKY